MDRDKFVRVDMATVVGIFENHYLNNKEITSCQTWYTIKKIYTYL